MEAVKVKFDEFSRAPETVSPESIGRIIVDAVTRVVNSTPHKVVYEVTESDVVERRWLKEVRTHRAVELKLTVKIPV